MKETSLYGSRNFSEKQLSSAYHRDLDIFPVEEIRKSQALRVMRWVAIGIGLSVGLPVIPQIVQDVIK